MKLGTAIEQARSAEAELAGELRKVGERHAVEHDLYHLTRTLARACHEHIERLRPHAARHGADDDPADVADSPALLEWMRRRSAELLGRSELTGMLLLRDLRNLYLQAQEAEIAWVILMQAARAARDGELLETVTEIHEDAELRGKWLRTRIKETAPQVLVAG
jgi:hypothetical protein